MANLKEIQNKILQYHWIKELAKNLNVLEESIVEELKKVKLGERPKIESGINKEDEQSYQKGGETKKTRINIIEERALALVFKKPEILSSIADRDIALLSEPMRTIFIAFKKEKIVSRFFYYPIHKKYNQEIVIDYDKLLKYKEANQYAYFDDVFGEKFPVSDLLSYINTDDVLLDKKWNGTNYLSQIKIKNLKLWI